MARVQLQAMESNAQSTRSQYEAFVQRLRSAQNMDEVQVPDARVISSAAVPLYPSGPKRTLIVGASIPLGILLGLLAALIAEKIGPMLPVRVNGAPRAALVPAMKPRARPLRPAAPVSGPVAVWNGPPILSEVNDPASCAPPISCWTIPPANMPMPWPGWCASLRRVKAAAPSSP